MEDQNFGNPPLVTYGEQSNGKQSTTQKEYMRCKAKKSAYKISLRISAPCIVVNELIANNRRPSLAEERHGRGNHLNDPRHGILLNNHGAQLNNKLRS